MSQETIINFLSKHKGKWFTASQISDKIGVSRGAVVNSVRALRKGNEVLYKYVCNNGISSIIYSIE